MKSSVGNVTRDGVRRQARFAQLQHEGTAASDLHGVGERLGGRPRTTRPFPAAIAGTVAASNGARDRGRASIVPSWMQTRASCDSKSSCFRKQTGVGGDGRVYCVSTRGRPRRRCSFLRRGGRGAGARCRTGRGTGLSRSRGLARYPFRSVHSSMRGRRRLRLAQESAIRPSTFSKVSQSRSIVGMPRCWPSR